MMRTPSTRALTVLAISLACSAGIAQETDEPEEPTTETETKLKLKLTRQRLPG